MQVRPLAPDDVETAAALAAASFAEVFTRIDRASWPPYEGDKRSWAEERVAHFLASDPAGSWVGEDEDGLAGVALASVRDGSWFLSLLAVRQDVQGRGLGGRLLDAALETAEGCDRAGLVSSSDPRALRRYASAGFTLLPGFGASGRLPAVADPVAGVRDGDWQEDRGLLDDVDLAVRQVRRGPDWDLLESRKHRLLVCDQGAAGRGYVVCRPSELVALAGTTEAVAERLLHAGLGALTEREGTDKRLLCLPGEAQWAVRAALAAGLSLDRGLTLCRRGGAPPVGCYLPHPALG